jgi:Cu+-exporting ATPase
VKIPFFGKKEIATAIDPVCGMTVETSSAPGGKYQYKDVTYYFCGMGCNKAFQSEPDEYLSGRKNIEMD